jgi:hypothetical protein
VVSQSSPVATAFSTGASVASPKLNPLPEPPAAVFREALPQLKQATGIPILLPSELPNLGNSLYVKTKGDRNSYTIQLSSVPRCTANACFIGTFDARRGAKPSFVQTVPLAQNLKGYYQPLSCGASCSPPEIAWVSNGVRYEVQLIFPSRDKEIVKKALVQIANSAIMAGPR